MSQVIEDVIDWQSKNGEQNFAHLLIALWQRQVQNMIVQPNFLMEEKLENPQTPDMDFCIKVYHALKMIGFAEKLVTKCASSDEQVTLALVCVIIVINK